MLALANVGGVEALVVFWILETVNVRQLFD
jgi:hypothetical protein